jgi:site-specific recombinase XerD
VLHPEPETHAPSFVPSTTVDVEAEPSSIPSALELVAKDFASASRAASTLDAYVKHWSAFVGWCATQGRMPLPATPQTLALYLAARASSGIRPATLCITLSAVAYEHERSGHVSPSAHRDVKTIWRGIRRRLGTASKKKDPISAGELRCMLDVSPSGLIGARNRALLLLGFAGGFRRSELVALQHHHLKLVSQGLEAFVERSKTDQEQRGHLKMIAYGSDPETCPVRALSNWIELSKIVAGPVFRTISRYKKLGTRALTGHAVAVIVKKHAAKAGLPTSALSAHSLRAGFVTAAASGGADYPSIMDQTGHQSLDTVHGYDRRKDNWKKPASAKLGL